MTKVEVRVGFWKSKAEPHLPMPVPDSINRSKKAEALAHLYNAESLSQVKRAYRGWSTCRLCGQPNGSEEFKWGALVWPSGYKHYIEEHDVAMDPRMSAAFGIPDSSKGGVK